MVDSTSMGDAARHLPEADLERALTERTAPPRDEGRVALVISKGPGGERSQPAEAVLTVSSGVAGDAWARARTPEPLAQITVMDVGVATIVANGQSLELFGDNLLVDLDLSAANLPPGSRLAVGSAVLEVTTLPHNGCSKFRARFGTDALRFVSGKARRELNLRGIYMRVVQDGLVRPGDRVVVLSRG